MNTSLPSATGHILFVGAGPGNPNLLTPRAHEILADTATAYVDTGAMPGVRELVVTDVPVPPELLKEAEEEYERTCAVAKAREFRRKPPRLALPTTADLCEPIDDPKKMIELLVEEAAKGSDVVRLVAGNPLTNNSLLAEINETSHAETEFQTVPGMSVPSTVPASADIALGSTYTETDLGRADVDQDELVQAPQPPVLRAAQDDPSAIAAELGERGLPLSLPVSVTVNGTARLQRTHDVTLGTLTRLSGDLTGPLVVTLGKGVDNRSKYSWWENRALYGRKVLVPRAKAQAGSMNARLVGHGTIPTEVPTIPIEPPRSPMQMGRTIKGLADGRYQWAIFTSVNAVTAVWGKFQELGLDARSFVGVHIAAVGHRTAAVTRDLGIIPGLFLGDTRQNAAGIVDVFPEYIEDLNSVNRVLPPRVGIGIDVPIDGLINPGWEIDDVVAYCTVRAALPSTDIRDTTKSGGFDAVRSTSGSTVKNLIGTTGRPHARTIIACIGLMAVATAHEYGPRVDVVPEHASIPELVDALTEHVAQLRAIGQLPPPRKKRRRSRKTKG